MSTYFINKQIVLQNNITKNLLSRATFQHKKRSSNTGSRYEDRINWYQSLGFSCLDFFNFKLVVYGFILRFLDCLLENSWIFTTLFFSLVVGRNYFLASFSLSFLVLGDFDNKKKKRAEEIAVPYKKKEKDSCRPFKKKRRSCRPLQKKKGEFGIFCN